MRNRRLRAVRHGYVPANDANAQEADFVPVRLLSEHDMKFLAAIPIFIRLYGFHRRGGKQVGTAVRLSARAFTSDYC